MANPDFMPYVKKVGEYVEKWNIHYYTGILPAPIIADMMADVAIRYYRGRLSERMCAIEIFRILYMTYKDLEKFERIILAGIKTDGKTH